MAKKSTVASFLPRDYKAPAQKSNYLNKFPMGETKFRILTSPVFGYVGWKDKKPIRTTSLEDFKGIKLDTSMYDPVGVPKYFWAMAIWDYNESCVRILELTKLSIIDVITKLSQDKDWGNPLEYDLKVTRSGEGKKTEYSVSPLPHKNVPSEASKALEKTPVDLQALFRNEDPFASSERDPNEVEGQLKIPF